jgi:hypothetical protein
MKRTTLNTFLEWLAGGIIAVIVPVVASGQEPVRLKIAYGQVYAVSGMT